MKDEFYPFKNFHTAPSETLINKIKYITENTNKDDFFNVIEKYLSKINYNNYENNKNKIIENLNISINKKYEEINIEKTIKNTLLCISITIYIYGYQMEGNEYTEIIDKYIKENNLKIFDTEEVFNIENQLSIKEICSELKYLNDKFGKNNIKNDELILVDVINEDDEYNYSYIIKNFIKYFLHINIKENICIKKLDSMISISYYTFFPKEYENNIKNGFYDLNKLPTLSQLMEIGVKFVINSETSIIPKFNKNNGKFTFRRISFRDGILKFYWGLLMFEKNEEVSGNLNGLFNMMSYFIRTKKDFKIAKEIGWINEFPEEHIRFEDLFWEMQYSHGYKISKTVINEMNNINEYYINKKGKILTELKILYFNNKWFTLATLSTILIFILTFLGTVFSGMQVL